MHMHIPIHTYTYTYTYTCIYIYMYQDCGGILGLIIRTSTGMYYESLCVAIRFKRLAYLRLVGNGGMEYNYNYYYYHSSVPY